MELHEAIIESLKFTFSKVKFDSIKKITQKAVDSIYSEEKSVKPGTIRVRIHEINKLLPYFAHLKLKDITGKKYQDALNDLKDRGYSDSTREGIHRTGRMIFRKALEMELIKKNPTEFSYLKKDKKTIEQLEEEEVPKYLEKEELALFLNTANRQGMELDYLMFLSYPTQASELENWLPSSGKM